jgi:hypothetical protein
MARCPAHNDRQPSLSIRTGRGGRTLIHCFAGCTMSAVLDAAKLRVRDLFPDSVIPVAGCSERGNPCLKENLFSLAAADKAAREQCRKLTAICDVLAGRLAHLEDDAPESDALTPAIPPNAHSATKGRSRTGGVQVSMPVASFRAEEVAWSTSDTPELITVL